MNQSTPDMQSESQQPKNQQYGENYRKHGVPLEAGERLKDKGAFKRPQPFIVDC
jgi:hypothetical protein